MAGARARDGTTQGAISSGCTIVGATTRPRLVRYWDRHARRYDRAMDVWDRCLFGDSRPWACGRATGDVLEVAVGTGRNLPFYPAGVRLTGVDWYAAMLGLARRRAAGLGIEADLREGDAQALDFPGESFDIVVCARAVRDPRRPAGARRDAARAAARRAATARGPHSGAIAHAARAAMALRAGQHPAGRRVLPAKAALHVRDLGFAVEETERRRRGVVERVSARKPATR